MAAIHSDPDHPLSAFRHGGSRYGGIFYASTPTRPCSTIENIKRETVQLGTLDAIVDRLHDLFRHWEEHEVFPEVVRTDMLNRARLVAHEWIAHLVQHADFEGRVPQIALSIWIEGDRLCCQIADNSRGFSLEVYRSPQLDDTCFVMPDRGMYWLLIQASTHRLSYHPLGNQGYELAFTIK